MVMPGDPRDVVDTEKFLKLIAEPNQNIFLVYRHRNTALVAMDRIQDVLLPVIDSARKFTFYLKNGTRVIFIVSSGQLDTDVTRGYPNTHII